MSSIPQTTKKDRLIFIDVMRGIAVLWMIETHVIDIVLHQPWKSGFFYGLVNISNGFVAVSFLFCAGAGFWLAAMKKVDDYKHFREPLFIYLRRLLLILVIAYSLHMPSVSLAGFFKYDLHKWLVFFEVDVLQTIVYTSFIALFLLMIIPKIKYIPFIFGVVSLGIFFFAPYIISLNALNFLPPYFAAMISQDISKFPLLPWSGYFFGGVAITALFMQTENKKRLSYFYFIGGMIIMLLMYYTQEYTKGYPYVTFWWRGCPTHSFFRIFGSIMVFGLLYLIEDKYRNTKVGHHLVIAGQESLFLYVSHLMIVYGSAMNFGFKYFIGGRLEWIGSFLIFAAITIFCYTAAYFWHELKAKNMKKARILMIAVFTLLIITFIVNPG